MLYGRDSEIALLDGWLRDLGERGRTLLLRGDPGIGKTALLDIAAGAARSRECRVLTVTGVECEAHLPFAGLHQLLRPVLARAEGLPTPQRQALLTAFRALGRPPIVMGHSFGGAFTEILLDRGLGAAGVATDAAAVRGILKLPFSTLKSAWPVLRTPANEHRAVALTPEEFHYAFGNALSEEDSQGALANFNPHAATRVDFGNPNRAPLLLIAGGADHIVPAAVDASAARHYAKSPAVTAYRSFPGRSHYTIGESGWEEVADYALSWAVENATIWATA